MDYAKSKKDNVKILKTIEINNDVTLNLDGFNITGDVNPLFEVKGGLLIVGGTGEISAPKGDAFSVLGNTDSDWSTRKITSSLKIDANINVVAKDNCIYIKGNEAKADVYGSLTTTNKGCATIQGNGYVESGKTIINIYEGASVINNYDVAIYHPQAGDLNIYGGTIKGTTGIEMRAGNLVVKNGTIIGTAVPTSVKPNGNGSTSTGTGIAVEQHTTKLPINVDIYGGIIKGYSALYQSNAENNEETAIAKVAMNVEDGKFETENGGTVVVYSENNKEFITGGTYNQM